MRFLVGVYPSHHVVYIAQRCSQLLMRTIRNSTAVDNMIMMCAYGTYMIALDKSSLLSNSKSEMLWLCELLDAVPISVCASNWVLIVFG